MTMMMLMGRGCGRLVMASAVLLGCAATTTAQTPVAPAPDVTVVRAAGGRVLIEVADGGVLVRKEVAGDASHVVISAPGDELQLRVARGELVASTPNGSVAVAAGRPAELAQLLALLQRSDAAVKGLALLKRLPADSRDFGLQALLLTRAVLELGAGQSTAITAHRREVARERERRLSARPGGVSVSRVGLAHAEAQGPGDCWDLYAKEAVRIAEDFVECTDDLKWYDVLGWAGCSLIYSVRAEGAMAWFISCNGGVPFKA